MEAPLDPVVQPERPDEYGLDVVVVHGLHTLGLPRLPATWPQRLLELCPANTRIIGHDADLRIEDKFKWGDMQIKATDLTNALRSWVEDELKHGHDSRVFVFVGIGMAGYIVKHTLFRFSQETRFRYCLERVRGLVFCGTPNFTNSEDRSALILSGILRYDTGTTGKWPSSVMKSDLSALVHSAWRFDELKLGCHIMTCFEQVPVKTRKYGVSRQTTMVDQTLAAIPAKQSRLRAIDTKLSSLLETTDCVIHCQMSDFFDEVYTTSRGSAGNNNKPDAAARKGPSALSPSPSDPFAMIGGEPLEPSLPIRGQVPTMPYKKPPSLIHSPTFRSIPSAGSPDSSAKLSTRQNVSSPSGVRSSISPLSLASESSYVLLPGTNEGKKLRAIRTPVEWVQAGSRRQQNPAFCGRSDVVAKMNQALLDTESKSIMRPNVFVLCGPAGVGKTQTTLHFFHTMKSEFDIRFWIQADSTDGLFTAYREISVRLGLETRDDSKDAVLTRELVKGWFTEPYEYFKDNTGRLLKWLLVIDNADNPDDVLDFWPYDGQGSIIITSRNRGSMTQNYFSESGLTLAAAWALEDMSPGAGQLLSVISLFTPASIPQEILTTTPERADLVSYPSNAEEFFSEIEKIESCSIITQQAGLHSDDPEEISIHPLIQEVVRGQLLNSKESIVSTFKAAVGLMTGVWPFETLPFYGFHDFDKIQRRDCCERLLPQVTQLVQFYQNLDGTVRNACTTENLLNLMSEIG
ncbi:hypothetical protein PG994_013697 [Apiospora phragmitis]|uniref:DUF7779 domain-containing protein n=1 Tax=Apiospora phragmitis TaxID=2905665 RepID=A0ABR1T9D1_9PEZI